MLLGCRGNSRGPTTLLSAQHTIELFQIFPKQCLCYWSTISRLPKFFTKSLWVCQYVLQNVITLITPVVAILWPLSWAETVCRDSAWPSSLECSCSKNESPKPWTYIYVFIYFYMCLISYKDIIRFISIFVSNAPLCIFVCRYHRIFRRLGSSLQGHQRLAWGRSQGKSPLLIGKPWCLSMFIIYKKGQFT
jgi:hypothetical protein